VAAEIGIELAALGREGGERGGEFREQALGVGQRRLGVRDPFIDTAALFDAQLDLLLEVGVFGLKPQHGRLGVRSLLLLAGDVGGKLHQPAVELGSAFLGTFFLAIEHVAGVREPLQPGCGAGLSVAQRRQRGGADRLDAGGFRLLAGALGHLANAELVDTGSLRHAGGGLHPAQVE